MSAVERGSWQEQRFADASLRRPRRDPKGTDNNSSTGYDLRRTSLSPPWRHRQESVAAGETMTSFLFKRGSCVRVIRDGSARGDQTRRSRAAARARRGARFHRALRRASAPVWDEAEGDEAGGQKQRLPSPAQSQERAGADLERANLGHTMPVTGRRGFRRRRDQFDGGAQLRSRSRTGYLHPMAAGPTSITRARNASRNRWQTGDHATTS